MSKDSTDYITYHTTFYVFNGYFITKWMHSMHARPAVQYTSVTPYDIMLNLVLTMSFNESKENKALLFMRTTSIRCPLPMRINYFICLSFM